VTYPAPKLHPLGAGAWGGSGARAVLNDLQRRFTEHPEVVLESDDVGRALQAEVLPVLRHHYENLIVSVPGDPKPASAATYVLAAGYTERGPFIVDIDPHGMIGHYEEVGFHAIGSGAPMAQQAGALLAHFRMTARPVDYGVVAAVRVLDDLDTTNPSVGGPMSVCRITPAGAEHLSADAVDRARHHVRRWIRLEQEALDTVFDD
jgi:proteasome beta subunit